MKRPMSKKPHVKYKTYTILINYETILLSKESFSLHWKDLFRSRLMLFYQDWSLVDYKICSCALQTAIDKVYLAGLWSLCTKMNYKKIRQVI